VRAERGLASPARALAAPALPLPLSLHAAQCARIRLYLTRARHRVLVSEPRLRERAKEARTRAWPRASAPATSPAIEAGHRPLLFSSRFSYVTSARSQARPSCSNPLPVLLKVALAATPYLRPVPPLIAPLQRPHHTRRPLTRQQTTRPGARKLALTHPLTHPRTHTNTHTCTRRPTCGSCTLAIDAVPGRWCVRACADHRRPVRLR